MRGSIVSALVEHPGGIVPDLILEDIPVKLVVVDDLIRNRADFALEEEHQPATVANPGNAVIPQLKVRGNTVLQDRRLPVVINIE